MLRLFRRKIRKRRKRVLLNGRLSGTGQLVVSIKPCGACLITLAREEYGAVADAERPLLLFLLFVDFLIRQVSVPGRKSRRIR